MKRDRALTDEGKRGLELRTSHVEVFRGENKWRHSFLSTLNYTASFFYIISHLIRNLYQYIVTSCRRVRTSTLLYFIGTESYCDLGSKTYKLNLRNYILKIQFVPHWKHTTSLLRI
jgi:hypothetical protein